MYALPTAVAVEIWAALIPGRRRLRLGRERVLESRSQGRERKRSERQAREQQAAGE